VAFLGRERLHAARRRIGRSSRGQPGERERLNALAALVETPTCRRAILLRHFGEDPPERCGNCDNCLNPPSAVDASVVAQKLLSAAFRTEMRFGLGHLTDVLAGKETDKIISFGHHRLSVFGIANDEELALVRPVSRALMARDALRADDFGGLSFGPGAKPILKGETRLQVVLEQRRQGRKARVRSDEAESPLFSALRAKRRAIASAAGMPPYVIFHDSTLREMAAVRPSTLSAMGEVPGVGAAKLDRYGPAFLDVITGFEM
jgi:ATP-dependent DNA helicase RecQ